MVVNKLVGGVSATGYPKTYDGKQAFGSYGAINSTQLAALSESARLERAEAYKTYVEALEPDLDIDAAIQTGYEDRRVSSSCPLPVTITITYGGSQGASVSGGGQYGVGDTVTLTATIADSQQHQWTGWYIGGALMSSNTTFQFTATQNVTVEARTALRQYTVTVTSENEAQGTVTGGGTYPYGTLLNLIATPIGDYALEGWYSNGIRLNGSPIFQPTVIGPATYEARFSLTAEPSYVVQFTNYVCQQV